MWTLPTARRGIIVAGCLAMAYTQLTMSPATIEFAHELGAGGWAIGILGALPTGMLFMQFAAAVVANHLAYRRRLWLAVSLVQRLICVPVGIGAIEWPSLGNGFWIAALLVVTAANHAMLHFCTPLWMSWMGDYLPPAGLSHYWGVRHRWMQITAALSLLLAAALLIGTDMDTRQVFAVLVVTGAVFGVADLLIFLRIEEPPVVPAPEPELRKVLTAPLREPDFRSFITFSCFWHFAAMVGAPFISLYLLVHVGMDLAHVMLLWMASWVGGALLSSWLGQLAETYGHRPVLVLSTWLKSSNMLALVLVPQNPQLAFWILIPVFALDAVLNAGHAIASNGFMLRNSPAENRTMYIAAGTALAGMVGGATSVAAGGALAMMSGLSAAWGGMAITGFHVLFAVSIVLRLVAVVLVRHVREANAQPTSLVLTQLIGATPLRMLRFPLGLYRSLEPASADGPATLPFASPEAGVDAEPAVEPPRSAAAA